MQARIACFLKKIHTVRTSVFVILHKAGILAKKDARRQEILPPGGVFLEEPAYSSQLPTVRGNGSTSRMLEMPVRYMTQRSKPRPKPAWRVEPYLRRSR